MNKEDGATDTRILSQVSFLQKGTGKDLLFLHGYGSSKQAFAAQIAYFSRFYRVTAIDFLGFGGSAPLTQPFSVGDYATWTRRVIDALGLKKPHVIAHSFGCRVLVKMAQADANAFDKIVLTGPAGIVLRRGLGYQIKVKTYRLVKKFAPRFAEQRFGSAEYKTLSPLQKESYKKIVNEDLREAAKTVQNRVLLVEGTRDTVTTLAQARVYEKSFPHAVLQEIEGGHFAFAENPIAFNVITEEFLYD